MTHAMADTMRSAQQSRGLMVNDERIVVKAMATLAPWNRAPMPEPKDKPVAEAAYVWAQAILCEEQLTWVVLVSRSAQLNELVRYHGTFIEHGSHRSAAVFAYFCRNAARPGAHLLGQFTSLAFTRNVGRR